MTDGPFSVAAAVTFCTTGASFVPVMVTVTGCWTEPPSPSEMVIV